MVDSVDASEELHVAGCQPGNTQTLLGAVGDLLKHKGINVEDKKLMNDNNRLQKDLSLKSHLSPLPLSSSVKTKSGLSILPFAPSVKTKGGQALASENNSSMILEPSASDDDDRIGFYSQALSSENAKRSAENAALPFDAQYDASSARKSPDLASGAGNHKQLEEAEAPGGRPRRLTVLDREPQKALEVIVCPSLLTSTVLTCQ